MQAVSFFQTFLRDLYYVPKIKEQTGGHTLDELSSDVKIYILEFLPLDQVIKIRRINRLWLSMIYSSHLMQASTVDTCRAIVQTIFQMISEQEKKNHFGYYYQWSADNIREGENSFSIKDIYTLSRIDQVNRKKIYIKGVLETQELYMPQRGAKKITVQHAYIDRIRLYTPYGSSFKERYIAAGVVNILNKKLEIKNKKTNKRNRTYQTIAQSRLYGRGLSSF